jgi:hypothetical protein
LSTPLLRKQPPLYLYRTQEVAESSPTISISHWRALGRGMRPPVRARSAPNAYGAVSSVRSPSRRDPRLVGRPRIEALELVRRVTPAFGGRRSGRRVRDGNTGRERDEGEEEREARDHQETPLSDVSVASMRTRRRLSIDLDAPRRGRPGLLSNEVLLSKTHGRRLLTPRWEVHPLAETLAKRPVSSLPRERIRALSSLFSSGAYRDRTGDLRLANPSDSPTPTAAK